MNIAVFSAKTYDRDFFNRANSEYGMNLSFFEARLDHQTVLLVDGHETVCVFVNDLLDSSVIEVMARKGVKLIALRCAGFNNVDLKACEENGIKVVRVPAYSPFAVAEHTVGLMLALNRHLHRAYNRVRDGNFNLQGLLGFDMFGKTVGIVGTGKIGAVCAKILNGFGCKLLGFDPIQNEDLEILGMKYVSKDELLRQSDIISLHAPLMEKTYHFINREALKQVKQDVMIINTSRGGLVETEALIDALKTGLVGSVGLDVYEEEDKFFFEDHSEDPILDDDLARLMIYPNVLITGHQAFFSREAMSAIAQTTLQNIRDFAQGKELINQVSTNL